MARVTINPTDAPGDLAYAGTALATVAADQVDGNQTPFSEDIVIVAHNTGASPSTVTITSAPDSRGRTKHITNEAIAAGQIRVYGPFRRDGWVNEGHLWFQGGAAEVEFGVLRVGNP